MARLTIIPQQEASSTGDHQEILRNVAMQEPSIAFVLDQPEDKAHRPGDELTGRVKLLGIDRPQVRELHVQFRGISRITVPSRLPWSVPSDSIVRSD